MVIQKFRLQILNKICKYFANANTTMWIPFNCVYQNTEGSKSNFQWPNMKTSVLAHGGAKKCVRQSLSLIIIVVFGALAFVILSYSTKACQNETKFKFTRCLGAKAFNSETSTLNKIKRTAFTTSKSKKIPFSIRKACPLKLIIPFIFHTGHLPGTP